MYARAIALHNGATMAYDEKARAWLSEIERRLWSDGRDAPPSVADVAAWVCELSDLYTLERGILARQQRDREHLAAKTLYFLASDAPKIVIALDECAARDARFAAPRTIVDVGCGVGATSVGALLWLGSRGQREVTILGVDHEPSVLGVWASSVRAAAAVVGVRVTLHTFADDGMARALPPETSLVLCQTALNERLSANRPGEPEHDRTAVDAVTRWATTAPTLLVEPALKATTRALQRLRDRLLAEGGIDVVAPCPHQSPCPMLAGPRDWCHEARSIRPTPRVAEIQAITRRRDDLALYSMLALAPRRPQSPPPDAHRWRLVSDALGSRGKTERWVCRGDGSLGQVRVLDRERSDLNAALVDAERGTLVRLPVLPEGSRIGPAQRVEVIDLGAQPQ